MNNVSAFTLCSALSGLFLLTTSFDHKNDSVALATRHSANVETSLAGTRWQMTDFKLDHDIDLDGDGHLDTNLMAFLKPCDLDNTLVFESTGKLSVDEGELKCSDNPDSSTPKPGNWHYDKATNSLRIDNPDHTKTSTWKIVDASDNYLKVYVINPQGESSSVATITLKML